MKKNGKLFPVLAMMAGLVIGSLPALAHHGTGISYDASKSFTLKGTVNEFRYANPHPQLFFNVKDEKGNVVSWTTEVPTDVSKMVRAGWSKRRSIEALKPGTVITVLVAPSKSGGPFGLANKIQNEKGEVLLRGADAAGLGQ